jgi:hypothetical protein
MPGWQGIDLLMFIKAPPQRLAPKQGTPRYCGAAFHSLACCKISRSAPNCIANATQRNADENRHFSLFARHARTEASRRTNELPPEISLPRVTYVNGGLKLTQFSHLQRLKTDTPQILCRIGVLEGGPKAQPERCLCGAALTQ